MASILRSPKTALSKLRLPKDINVNSLLYLIVFIAIFVYLLKINQAVYYFIFSSIIVVLYIVSADLPLSISVAGIVTALVFVYIDSKPLKKRKSMLGKRYEVLLEHLEDGSGEEKKDDAKVSKKSSKEGDAEGDAEGDNEEDKKSSKIVDGEKAFPEEAKASKKETKKATKASKKPASTNSELKEVFQTLLDEFEPNGSGKSEIDSKGSYLNMFKSMDEKEIKTLNKDTKDLINTQKKLMETLETMGPALQQGKSILDTFKNYFGNEKKVSEAVM